MRHVSVLVARVVLGSYLTVHGLKKLSGKFGGPGLDATASGFESMGLRPGKPMAGLAGVSQVGGGILTLTGIADPLGPLMIAGNMAVAGVALRKNGPMAQNGGYELPLADMALALALISSGTGVLRLGPRLSKRHQSLAVAAALVLALGPIAQLLGVKMRSTSQPVNTD